VPPESLGNFVSVLLGIVQVFSYKPMNQSAAAFSWEANVTIHISLILTYYTY